MKYNQQFGTADGCCVPEGVFEYQVTYFRSNQPRVARMSSLDHAREYARWLADGPHHVKDVWGIEVQQRPVMEWVKVSA